MKKLFFLCYIICQAQNKYPETLFISPLDIPIIPAGTFGELRPNHFHSGLDIKTQMQEGLAVRAIGNGVISRIKIAHGGFGKVLYLTHPNGYTSVYAHLQKFSPKVEAYIKKRQYERETYEIELFPKAEDVAVQQGEIIAYSGNTGSSAGPHLHFEIRDSATEKPINPLFFGISLQDTQPPSVEALYGYALSDDTQVNQSNEKIKIHLKRQKDGSFLADTLYAEGKIGFGLDAHDRQDLNANKNGLYSVEMTVNGTPYLSYDFETFSFDESPLINTFIDYEYYATYGERIQQCFILPYNTLSIYNHSAENGIVSIADNAFYEVVLRVADFNQNITVLKIPVKGKKQPIAYKKEVHTTPYFIKHDQENRYTLGKATVLFPAHTFYRDFYINLVAKDTVYTIQNREVPVKNDFTLSFDVSGYSPEEREKLFIARLNGNGALSYQNTKKSEAVFSARTKAMGTYTLATDKTPPTITPRNFKDNQWLSNYQYLSLEIKDSSSGIASYRATLNGKWILVEYEPKNNTLTYNFEDLERLGGDGVKYLLEVLVTDNVGNKSIFTATFYRKS